MTAQSHCLSGCANFISDSLASSQSDCSILLGILTGDSIYVIRKNVVTGIDAYNYAQSSDLVYAIF